MKRRGVSACARPEGSSDLNSEVDKVQRLDTPIAAHAMAISGLSLESIG